MQYTFFSNDNISSLVNSSKLSRLIPDVKLRINEIKGGLIIPEVGVFDGDTFLRSSYWGGDINANELKVTEYAFDDSEVYYLGTFHPCWGHEITDGTRLLWGLFPELSTFDKPDNLRFVYTLRVHNEQLNQNFKDLLSSIGIKDEALICLHKPTKFKKVFIADESYWYDSQSSEKRTFSKTYANMFELLLRRIIPTTNKPEKIVYFSRSAWKKGNPDFGEKYIEDAFVKYKNCEVIYPEKLNFIEMVNLLQNTATLITTEGSISHNALFMQKGTNLVILRKANFISYYQLMINQIKDLNVIYIDSHLTHHFYNKKSPYFGPFFLYINNPLARYLHIKPYFPLITYCHYRIHIIRKKLYALIIRIAIHMRSKIRKIQ